MLVRVRVTLPDRPGALGQVARTVGVCGADIVTVVVWERRGGSAVDDLTVNWPGAAPVGRLVTRLGELPGVVVEGVWRVAGAPTGGSQDVRLVAQLAEDPDTGLATLVDAVPELCGADWAAVLAVPPEWPTDRGVPPAVVKAGWQLTDPAAVPEVSPVRARPVAGPDGARYATAPFGRAGLVLVAARVHGEVLPPAAFHRGEVDRLADLVRAAAVVLGDRVGHGSGGRAEPIVSASLTTAATSSGPSNSAGSL